MGDNTFSFFCYFNHLLENNNRIFKHILLFTKTLYTVTIKSNLSILYTVETDMIMIEKSLLNKDIW